MQTNKAVTMIGKSIEMFLESNPKHLKTINIIIFDKHLLPAYQRLASEPLHRPAPVSAGVFSDGGKFVRPTSTAFSVAKSQTNKASRSKSLILKFCSLKKETNEKVIYGNIVHRVFAQVGRVKETELKPILRSTTFCHFVHSLTCRPIHSFSFKGGRISARLRLLWRQSLFKVWPVLELTKYKDSSKYNEQKTLLILKTVFIT